MCTVYVYMVDWLIASVYLMMECVFQGFMLYIMYCSRWWKQPFLAQTNNICDCFASLTFQCSFYVCSLTRLIWHLTLPWPFAKLHCIIQLLVHFLLTSYYPPPRKLTWQWNIHHLKMYFLLKMGIFQNVILVFRGETYLLQVVFWKGTWQRS